LHFCSFTFYICREETGSGEISYGVTNVTEIRETCFLAVVIIASNNWTARRCDSQRLPSAPAEVRSMCDTFGCHVWASAYH
jgi:hypothetical protein